MKNWNYSKIGNNYDQYSIYEDTNPSKDIVNSVEGEDNAKLISAAPDLLEACESILHSMAHEGVAHGGRVAESVNQLQQAINKAKS